MASIVRLHLRFENASAATAWLEQASVLGELDDEAFEADIDEDEEQVAVTPDGLNLMLAQEYADGQVKPAHEAPRTVRELLAGPGLELTVDGSDVTCVGEREELGITDEIRLVHALLAAQQVATGELQLLFVSFGFDGDPFHARLELVKGVVRSLVVGEDEAEKLASNSAQKRRTLRTTR